MAKHQEFSFFYLDSHMIKEAEARAVDDLFSGSKSKKVQ